MRKFILNGYGRIGRIFTKLYSDDPDKNFQLVAINDLQDYDTCRHLSQYDSVYGKQDIDLSQLNFTQSRTLQTQLAKTPGAIVLDATGVYTQQDKASEHLDFGASNVILSAPGKGEKFKTVCYGINHDTLRSSDRLISAASCTTGALAPIVKFFNSYCQLDSLLFTTVHAATGDQRVQDSGHSDLRRARSVFGNLIPTATGGSSAIKAIFPDIDFPIHGLAIRSPHAAVSLLDLSIFLKESIDNDVLYTALEKACTDELHGLLRLEKAPLVSSDFIKEPCSSVIDLSTLHVQDRSIKFLAWYDNEYGYAHKLYHLSKFVAQL